jgi:hypothetical protein
MANAQIRSLFQPDRLIFAVSGRSGALSDRGFFKAAF